MALLSLSLSAFSSSSTAAPADPSLSTTISRSAGQITGRPHFLALVPNHALRRPEAITRASRNSHVVFMAPQEHRITRLSPTDFPAEFRRSRPGTYIDIVPQFCPLRTPLPPPLPMDPPQIDEDLIEEEELMEEEQYDDEPEERDFW